MEAGRFPAIVGKKPTLSPKAIIHQKFGTSACYKIEEVQDFTQNGCPGLVVSQKGPCLYRCFLELPNLSVMSETFRKKKDAEQSAAEMALEKLGFCSSTNILTVEEAWNDLISRVSYLFSNEFLSSLHPLSGHFRAALRRDGDLCGLLPVSVIAVFDAKLINLCKAIDDKVESNPFLVLLYTVKAVARLSGSLVAFGTHFSIRRQNPYPREIIEASATQPAGLAESMWVKAIHIPCELGKAVESVSLNVLSSGYYLDVIAKKLGLTDGNRVLMSRPIGKTSSEKRLYFSGPRSDSFDFSSGVQNSLEAFHFEGSLNERASNLYGQPIYGDAILASIGYMWKSQDLFCEDVTLQSYYRIILGKIPSGTYKLSRDALLAAELPIAFTTKTNWRGSFPREILCAFCRQHWLGEPVFSNLSIPLEESSDFLSSSKNSKVLESAKPELEKANGGATVANGLESVGLGSSLGFEVKIFSKSQELIMDFLLKKFYKKQNDSIQIASLKVLSWIDAYLKGSNMHLEEVTYSADALHTYFYRAQNLFKEFAFFVNIEKQHNVVQRDKSLESSCMNAQDTAQRQCIGSSRISGPDSSVYPSNGSLICIGYSVFLVPEDESWKELLENQEEFEFEMGTGAVIPCLEAVVAQMSVGQSACFNTLLLPKELILAAADDSVRIRSLLSTKACYLEYAVILLRVSEPPEERMEQALFSPPLSRQRVEYALQHIKESSATTLVDFGCGSGSLLDSLLDYSTSLETIVGIDISQKSLTRAAKMLHSKLSMKATGINSAVLYDGSILDFDSRLHGFDIGTCLEVIEHMEEDQACLFGEVVLSHFQPKVLIISTPNYEYNVILQRSSMTVNQEDDPEENTQLQSCKFRNHDHKFEWTREQFSCWATKLATKHNYLVEFGGVGGSADVEPGFASQIAVFRRKLSCQDDGLLKKENSVKCYNVLWEWKNREGSDSAA